MSSIINPLITDAGLAAAVAASGLGLQLAITHIALGDGQYTPAVGLTAMAGRKEKVAIPSGYVTGSGGFRINALFPSWAGTPNPYNATEIGFYAGDPDAGGILFAVHSHTSAVIVQRNSLDYVVQFSMQLTRVPAGSVTVTVDPGASQMLALMAAHEAAADPHPLYALKSKLGNFAGQASLNATGAIAASDAGKRINVACSSVGQVITLPNASAIPVGGSFFISNGGNTFTLQCAGADIISPDGSIKTAITVNQGDWVLVSSGGTSGWLANGSATLIFSGSFGASKVTNGYQKLPSGLIIQWGTLGNSLSDIVTTLPIAFPTTGLQVIATNGYTAGSGSVGYVAASFTSTTQITTRGSSGSLGGSFLAIGM